MKKSILLNEDEKNRILNLHETAKNLYENKKPVSLMKETNRKKEDMKKVIKLTESDLEKIVRRVIEEQYMGVAFGGEQNGLKIKKMETKEQAAKRPVPQKGPVITPQMMGIKPVVKKVLDVLDAKAKQGDQSPSTVVSEDPKAVYVGSTFTQDGQTFVNRVDRYVPILGEANYPFPKWVIQTTYTKGESQAYTNPDGSVSQNAFNKWDVEPNQIDATRPQPQDVTDSFAALQSYRVNPDDFKKAIIAIYSDPKMQVLLPKAKQIAQTSQTVPPFYKQVLSSIG